MEEDNKKILKQAEKYMRELNSFFYFNAIVDWAENGKEINETIIKAFEILDSVFLKDFRDESMIKLSKGSKYYRARKIDVKDYKRTDKGLGYSLERIYGFNASESKEPPIEYCTEDYRMSPAGIVALYLASDEITACVEVRPEIRRFISVAEFELTEDIFVLDFSELKEFDRLHNKDIEYEVDTIRFVKSILFLFTEPVYNSDNITYKVTQKIVEHYKQKGVKGFKYKSFYSDGTNYTFFDDMMSKFKWIDSRVLLNYVTANLLISLDEKEKCKDINNIVKVGKTITNELRDKLRHNMKKLFRYKEEEQ